MLAVPAYSTSVPASVQPWASVQGYYAPLGSPGDGWPPFLRPIPSFRVPTAAYHFLSVAEPEPTQEQLRLMQTLSRNVSGPSRSPSSSWDQRNTGKLRWVFRLPMEVLDLIVGFAVVNGSGPALAQTSSTLRCLCTPKLYRQPVIRSSNAMSQLLATLCAQPDLAGHVREMDVQARSVPWADARALADILLRSSSAGRLDRLAVHFQGSDLSLALPFLQRLSPRKVEWSTSPCWYMRPEDLFIELLSGWQDLVELKIAGFAPDQVMSSVIASAPSLEAVEIRGAALARLDVETLATMLALALRDGRLLAEARPGSSAAESNADASAMDVDGAYQPPTTTSCRHLAKIRLSGVPFQKQQELLGALPQLLLQLQQSDLDAVELQKRYGPLTPPASPDHERAIRSIEVAQTRRIQEAALRERISQILEWA
ncbi:hypothetical protein CBOM_01720 [Ceraceosorus bombacis]|uniref:Uncharacterized protein n=1 Tax=Ceraceosorus bombacis TaxID=401625 RepID=A0A0P1BD31_9BASI|nr:hypothetical protein CBOM_01720 [Ceraceosorus bombacis]